MGRGPALPRSLSQRRADSRSTPTRAACALILVAALLSALPLGHVAANETEVAWARIPDIQIGDHWTFVIEGREEGTIYNEVKTREVKRTDFGTDVDSLRIHGWGTVYSEQLDPPFYIGDAPVADPQGILSLTTTEHEIEADKWVRHDDHAVVETSGTVRVQGAITAEVSEAFNPPLVHSLYPFAVGYKWVAEAKWHQERGSEDPVTKNVDLNAEVISYERVGVPAGTFDAWKIEYDSFRSGSSRILQWWSQEACGIVKEEQYDRDNQLVNTLRLADFSCSGDHAEEPSYRDRNVWLRSTGGNDPPPWLLEPPPEIDDERGPGPQHAALLPGGTLLWVAVAMIAASSVLFIVVSRRRA